MGLVDIGTIELVDSSPWIHSYVLSALLWARANLPPHRVSIQGDVHGIFQNSRFDSRPSHNGRTFLAVLQEDKHLEISHFVKNSLHMSWSAAMAETAKDIEAARKIDLMFVGHCMALHTLEWMVGGLAVLGRIISQVVDNTGVVKLHPSWLPGTSGIRKARRYTAEPFVLVEQPLSERLPDLGLPVVELSPAVDANLFNAVASSSKCAATIVHSVDGATLSYPTRTIQVVDDSVLEAGYLHCPGATILHLDNLNSVSCLI